MAKPKISMTVKQMTKDIYRVLQLKNTTSPNTGDELSSKELDSFIRCGYDVTIK